MAAPSSLGLYCLPRSVPAGGQVNCEVRVTDTTAPVSLNIATSAQDVHVPSVVTTRALQTRLAFRASIEPLAKQQTATISASVGDLQIQDAIAITAPAGPVLSVPFAQAVKGGEPLGFTVHGADSAGLPIVLSATGLPAGASFDAGTGEFHWTPNSTQKGEYDLTFAVANSVGVSSDARVHVEVGTGVPRLTTSSPLTCSPNAIASLSGWWLGKSETGVSEPSGSALDLEGTGVKVNGQSVPVLFSSATRVDFLCPALAADTPLSVVVETPDGSSDPLAGSALDAAPRILSLGAAEQDQGMITFAGSDELAMPRNARRAGHPAQPGEAITVWVTGLGLGAENRQSDFSATVGGVFTPVQSVQAVPGHAGLYTIQLQAPVAFGDALPVQIGVVTPRGLQVQSNSVSTAVEVGNN